MSVVFRLAIRRCDRSKLLGRALFYAVDVAL